MTRLVMLVVDYLCHVIVHFSCMYEIGPGDLRSAPAGAIPQLCLETRRAEVVQWGAKATAAKRTSAFGDCDPDAPGAWGRSRGRCISRICPAPCARTRERLRLYKYQ
jgi:hypothetical protein